MSTFTTSYNDLIGLAESVIRKKDRELLYTAPDVVHEAFLQCSETDSLNVIRKKVYYLAMRGTVYSCSHFHLNQDNELQAKVPFYHWSEFQEKMCPKCMEVKTLSDGFGSVFKKREGVGYFYFNKYCKQCTPKTPRSEYAGITASIKAQKQRDELTDQYIFQLIKKELTVAGQYTGKRCITPQMLALRRMQIIEKRIKRENRFIDN